MTKLLSPIGLALPLLVLSCASQEQRPMTWEEHDAPELAEDGSPGAKASESAVPAYKPKEKSQKHFDRVAENEFSFMSCGHSARQLQRRSEKEAIKMLYGCMKRTDFRDTQILREAPFYDALKKDPEGRRLVLNVLRNRDEGLQGELNDLRLKLRPVSDYLEDPKAHPKDQFVVKGRVVDEWYEDGKRIVAIMERTRTAAGYNRYSTRYIRSGRSYERVQQKTFVPKSRYSRGNKNEVVDTGLIVVFTVNSKKKLAKGPTFLFLGAISTDRLKSDRSLADALAPAGAADAVDPDIDEVEEVDDSDDAIGIGAEDDFEDQDVKVTPQTPLLSLEAALAL